MTEFAAPSAKRLQQPSWRDSRLIVGVLLVLLAATLGAKAIASADDRVAFYVTTDNLVAGERIDPASFKRVDIALADGMSGYVRADSPPPVGKFLLRDVRAGELIPESALGAADDVDVQRVTLRADSVSTSGVAKGSRVDVYVTPKVTPGVSEVAPRTTKVLSAVAVASVQTSGGGFGSNSTTSVQVYVPAAQVQPVVEAVDRGAKLTLVPVVGAVGTAAS